MKKLLFLGALLVMVLFYCSRTGYNDKKTPKRWVYHVDDYYVQDQSFDGAIKYAIELVKTKK